MRRRYTLLYCANSVLCCIVCVVCVVCYVYCYDSIPTVRLRTVKSYLRSVGVNILVGSEQLMRAEMDATAARYKDGTVNGIPFVRCVDIVTELREFVESHARKGTLTRRLGAPDDALRVTLSVDKGGSYTKAFLTVWDADQSLSPLHAVFVGVYRGTDDHESIRAVFGPVIEQLERIASDIVWPYSYNVAGAPLLRQRSSLDHIYRRTVLCVWH